MSDGQNSQPDTTTSTAKSRWRRWLLGIGLAIPVLPVLAFVVLYLLNPGATLMVARILLHPLLANTRPPAMFADQLTGVRVPGSAETSRQLTARLQQQFPVGTTEPKLKEALLAQGFKPPEAPQDCVQPVQNGQPLQAKGPVAVCPPQDQSKSLKYEWSNVACRATIWVRWSTDASDVITRLDGYYAATCL